MTFQVRFADLESEGFVVPLKEGLASALQAVRVVSLFSLGKWCSWALTAQQALEAR